jgi:hypothetical protein
MDDTVRKLKHLLDEDGTPTTFTTSSPTCPRRRRRRAQAPRAGPDDFAPLFPMG